MALLLLSRLRMKTFSFLILVLSIIGLGCGKSNSAPKTKGSYNFTDEINAGFPSGALGGQPSVLTLRGVVVTPSGEVDGHIHVEQIGGANLKGEKIEVEKSKLIEVSNLSDSAQKALDLISENNFVSLGCDQEDVDVAAFIEGKIPLPAEEAGTIVAGIINADTVLLCGQTKLGTIGLQVNANTVLLKGLEITSQNWLQKVSIVSRNLVITDKNSILSVGNFVPYVPNAGADITLEVGEKISGTGSLLIHDEGATATKSR
jgi:hypothetical protein